MGEERVLLNNPLNIVRMNLQDYRDRHQSSLNLQRDTAKEQGLMITFEGIYIQESIYSWEDQVMFVIGQTPEQINELNENVWININLVKKKTRSEAKQETHSGPNLHVSKQSLESYVFPDSAKAKLISDLLSV